MERKVQIVSDAAALSHAAAEVFTAAARQAVGEKGNFTVALSGGSTPKALYGLLTGDAELRSRVPWQQTYFFFGDERHVAPDHADSNYRTAHQTLLSKIPIAAGQVFRMKGEYPDAVKGAAEYEDALREYFHLPAGRFPRFDLVMLGMGPDGHTASLFPGTKALEERNRLVTSNWVGKFYTHRITMTAPVLNNAACVMFMAHGPDKAQPLKAVLEGPYEPAQLPAQLIRPPNGTLLWLVDESAGGLLDRGALRPPKIAATG
ncbi:MAG: 6-phosphogluconolactonase [Acidobacteriia bacterium]|nr:6-phosphogluconolactonase [Terriglobia bacterium]